jgi:hypothetical protein
MINTWSEWNYSCVFHLICKKGKLVLCENPPHKLVVEPDYLPDSEVFYFQPCLYPMKYLHPRSMYTLPRRGVQRGGTPSAGSGGAIPWLGGLGASGPPAGVRGRSP